MSKSLLFASLARPSARFGESRSPTSVEVSEAPPRFRRPVGSGESFTLLAKDAQALSSQGWVVDHSTLSAEEAGFLNKHRPDLGSHVEGDLIWFVRPYRDADLKPGLGKEARQAAAKYTPPVQISGFQILPGPATDDISGIDSETLQKAVGTLRIRRKLDKYWTEQTALYRSIGAKPPAEIQRRLDRLAVLLAKSAQPAEFAERFPMFAPSATSFGVAGVDDAAGAVVAAAVVIPVAYYLYAAVIALAALYTLYLMEAKVMEAYDTSVTKTYMDICSDPKASKEARAAACAYVEEHKPPKPPPDFTEILMWGGVALAGLYGASLVLPTVTDSLRDSMRGRRD